MNTNINIQGASAVIELEGRLDTPSSPAVEAEVGKVSGNAEVTECTVDCSKLTYISSSGLRILISLHKSFLKKQGKLTIKSLAPEIKEVFDMTGLYSIFTIVD